MISSPSVFSTACYQSWQCWQLLAGVIIITTPQLASLCSHHRTLCFLLTLKWRPESCTAIVCQYASTTHIPAQRPKDKPPARRTSYMLLLQQQQATSKCLLCLSQFCTTIKAKGRMKLAETWQTHNTNYVPNGSHDTRGLCIPDHMHARFGSVLVKNNKQTYQIRRTMLTAHTAHNVHDHHTAPCEAGSR